MSPILALALPIAALLAPDPAVIRAFPALRQGGESYAVTADGTGKITSCRPVDPKAPVATFEPACAALVARGLPAGIQPAVSTAPPTAWLSSKDMPAMRESYLTEAGTIEMLYEVDATGRVAACSIYKSTGDVDLDTLACSALLLRGRFEPATYKGAAVPSLGVLRYRFVVR